MSVLGRVARYAVPHRRALAVAVGLVVLHAALEVAKPWPIKIVADHVLGDRVLAALPGVGKPMLLALACIGLLVLSVGLAAVNVLLNRATVGIGQHMVSDLRAELVTHLQRLSLGFFSSRPTADLAYRVAFDTYAVQSIAMNGIMPSLTAAVLLLGMVAVMLHMNVVLAGIFLAVAPLLFFTMRLLGRRIAALSSEFRENESRFLSHTQQGVGAMQTVQAFTAEERERERILRASRRALGSALRLYVFQSGYSGAVSVVIALGTAAVLYAGGVLGMAGQLSVGDLIVFVTYLTALAAPITSVSETVGLVQEGSAGARRVFQVLDTPPTVADAPGARSLADVQGTLRFEGVSFTYAEAPASGFALRDVSFEATAGTRVALVGPTGAGKTTLMSLIPRFADPASGRVLLDGHDLRDLALHWLRAQIGVVAQVPVLFPATLAENIRYGNPTASDDDVLRAAELADVSSFAKRLPAGFETPIGPEGHALSQGQAQRVTIARALVKDPRILLLDEPTSALDVESERYVMAGIARAMEGRTTIAIAHRLSTVRRADQVLVLDQGHIVESGPYDSLRHADGPFQRLHELL
jgi:ATP-binding cassette subfamily B protein/subfamily B ATP-binding cassette protein MsbA